MKKQLTKITTLAFAFLSFAAFPQAGRVQPCATYDAMEAAFKADPASRIAFEKHEQESLKQMLLQASRSAAAPEYTVPVVFHILYDCANLNLVATDAVCIAALDQVNSDYARKGSDTNLIFTPFKNSYINSDIKFMLAKRDKDGNCFNGIVRHYNSKTRWAQASANLVGVIGDAYYEYTWDPTKYLNIYVVADIISSPATPGSIVVGYTYKNGGTFGSGNPHDAIVYNANYLSGSQNNIPKVRSLSHEIGHWLNLAHTFGSTNNPGISCGDDGLNDTPPTKGDFGGCPASSTNSNVLCGSANLYYSNVENIMNYSDCARNFTSDQTQAMRNCLANSFNGRNNLSTPGNLAFTGVDNPGLCAPIAEFESTNCSYTVCAGSSLSFRDLSFNGVLTSYNWTADNGGVAANPTASLTSIMFPTAGVSNVKVTVTTAQGSAFKVKTVTVISAVAGITGPHMESFELPGPPPNWTIINPDNDAAVWTQTNSAAYDQYTSYMIVGALNGAGKTDLLQMPTIDLLNNQNNIFEFAYAYRQQSSSHNDVFKVEGSKDCGGTWNSILSINAANLAAGSGGVSNVDFTPASNEWKTYTLSSHPSWQSYKNSSSVMLRFNFTSGGMAAGNNFFLDAINFYSITGPVTGINEFTKSIQFGLYPNPTSGEATVNFNLQDPAQVKVSVLDIMGREVLPSVENNYPAGEQSVLVNKNNTLSKGVYFVNLTVNGAKMSSKLVIN